MNYDIMKEKCSAFVKECQQMKNLKAYVVIRRQKAV